MPEDITSVKLKFSCQENWDVMQPVEGGHFCNKCNKPVYDFTNAKADDFRKIMAEFPGTCGLYKSTQALSAPPRLSFWNKWLSAAVLLLGFNVTGCHKENKPQPGVFKQSAKSKNQDLIMGKAMFEDSTAQPPHVDQVRFPPPSLKKNLK
ncbi:hypothetical protein [Mucilaginibacter agri]|nr:hypothetical protein [Mucilaginibacter agri]